MNQKEIYRRLELYLPDLDLKNQYFSDNSKSPYSYVFRDLVKYRRVINTLDRLGLLPITSETREDLKPILDSKEETLGTDFSPGHKIESAGKTVYEIIEGIISYLNTQLKEVVEENTIDIKLVKIDDLEDLEKTASLLKKSFSIPLHEIDSKVVINSLEKGSVWIILSIIGISGVALRLCANLIWAGAVIYRKYEEVKITQEHLRTIKLKNDLIEGVVKQQLEYIEESKSTEATAIANEFMPNHDNESIQRLKLSIESIGSLIEKGAQFYPSIKAADDVKQLFPDFDVLNLIESKTKLISEAKENSN